MPLKPTRYNGGVVSIYREKDLKTSFNAKKNVSTLDDMEFMGKLDFKESSRRQQDLDFAEQSGFVLSYKIQTHYVKSVDNKCKALIDGVLYDIRYIDKSGVDMFLYMEGGRPIATDD